jgi:hypothetical protein
MPPKDATPGAAQAAPEPTAESVQAAGAAPPGAAQLGVVVHAPSPQAQFYVSKKAGMFHQAGQCFFPGDLFEPATPLSKRDLDRHVAEGSLVEIRPYVGPSMDSLQEVANHLEAKKAGAEMRDRVAEGQEGPMEIAPVLQPAGVAQAEIRQVIINSAGQPPS